MLLRLSPYDCVIKYLPGRETVTRLSPLDEFEALDMNVKVHHLVRITPAPLLQQLSQQVVHGWPDSVKEVDPTAKPYWSLRDDISVENGLVLLGSRVIVPESSRGNILQQIHGGYFGIEKCKLRAKSCVYWPSIYREIERLINSCSVCHKHTKVLSKKSFGTVGDLLKTVANRKCRSVLRPTVVVSYSC